MTHDVLHADAKGEPALIDGRSYARLESWTDAVKLTITPVPCPCLLTAKHLVTGTASDCATERPRTQSEERQITGVMEDVASDPTPVDDLTGRYPPFWRRSGRWSKRSASRRELSVVF